MRVPAVVAAGDRRAAKAVRGESKPYLELGGRTFVARVVETLQRVPEVSEIWVVGNRPRLEAALEADAPLRASRTKPVHVVPQFRSLYENLWETYRRLLPGAPPEGRDPGPEDAEQAVLFLSADIPFATPQEISAFVREGLALGCDYAFGACTEESMRGFYPAVRGGPGIRMAYFNLREARLRQSNLHLVKPAKLGHRFYIEEMYEHRYQREFGQVLALAWRLLRAEGGGLRVIYYYLLMQLASLADRSGWRKLADRIRERLPMARIEAGMSALLATDFRLVVTEAGGCAVDIDNDGDYEAARLRLDEWADAQRERAEKLYGPMALPERSGGAPG